MATIVLDVQDDSLLTQIKKACQLLKGVSSVKVQRTPTAKIDDITKTAGYKEAMDDVKHGRVTEYASLKDFYKDGATEGVGTLRVTATPVQWGTPIYMIPIPAAKPMFEVIYDVVVVDENGKDIVTRENIHSFIEVNEANFGEISQTTLGKIRPVTIKIVPDHLYVLADADQKFSWIVLGDGND